jgi:hypothetical protein
MSEPACAHTAQVGDHEARTEACVHCNYFLFLCSYSRVIYNCFFFLFQLKTNQMVHCKKCVYS